MNSVSFPTIPALSLLRPRLLWPLAASVAVLSLAVSSARAEVFGQAFRGEPYGVGHVMVMLPEGDAPPGFEADDVVIKEADGRILYPAFSSGIARELLRELVGLGGRTPPGAVTIHFLFTGDEPLRLTVYSPTPQEITLRPMPIFARLGRAAVLNWWRDYNVSVRRRDREGTYPPLIDGYLTAMLARRLDLDPPLLSRWKASNDKVEEPLSTLQLVLGVDSLRAQAVRDIMLREERPVEPAELPVPPDIEWAPRELPPPAGEEAEIEPIANHVPEDCFYLRFGSFANAQWVMDLLENDGADLFSLLSPRGHAPQAADRLVAQLGLPAGEDSTLVDLLGGAVIADVALVGRDTFLNEGAAIGIVLQARFALLKRQIDAERAKMTELLKDDGATLETVDVAGRKVTLLSRPDNRLRSYYAVDGDFHLITTSRAIVEQFFAAGEGKRSLGDSDEFRHARLLMPNSRGDTIFIYLSTKFFQGLVSPQYQIELKRRIQAVAEMELIQLARLAAANEGVPGETIAELVAAGLLPGGFGERPDGSGPIVTDQRVIDSLRGARGTFVPIADMELRGVTADEAEAYAQRAEFYATDWKQMDPLMVGIKRFAVDREGRERLVIDANVAPFGEQKYGWLMSLLGEPTAARIRAEGNVIEAQASLKGGLISDSVAPHLLFLGVQDHDPLGAGSEDSLWTYLKMLAAAPLYVGSTPKAGFIDLLPFGLAGETDEEGFSELLLGVQRKQWDDYSMVSLHRELLEDISRRLIVEEAEQPSHIWVRVADLTESKLDGLVSRAVYKRGHDVSVANAWLMNALSQQLSVPPEKAKEVAEALIDAQLVCGLDGEYVAVRHEGGAVRWESTQWPEIVDGQRRIPEDYRPPVLRWFRGGELELTRQDDRLTAHAEMEMQRKVTERTFELPLFNLFPKAGGGDDPAEGSGAKN